MKQEKDQSEDDDKVMTQEELEEFLKRPEEQERDRKQDNLEWVKEAQEARDKKKDKKNKDQ